MFLLLRFSQNGCRHLCVYIHFGHFGGLSNKNITKRPRVWNLLCFFPSTGTPQDFSLCRVCGILRPLLRVYHWERALGIWGLASCWLVIVSNLYFMFKACLHRKRERKGGRERKEEEKLENCSYNNKLHHLVCQIGKRLCMLFGQTQWAVMIMGID